MTRWRLREYLWPALILLWVGAAWLVTFVVPDTALRPVVVLTFLFVCPGMALSRLLRLENTLIELLLGIALSITLDSIVACILLYTGQWSPTLILEMLIILSLAGATGQLFMGRMLAQNIPMFSTDTPIPTDIRMQLAMYNTLMLPNTPIPVDIRNRDTMVTEQVVPRHVAFVGIAEKDTIEVPRIARRKTLFRNILEIDTAEMRQVQTYVANTPHPMPDIETIETRPMQRSMKNAPSIPDMDTVAMQAISWRDVALVDTHEAKAVKPQRLQQYKAIVSSITDLETVETQQAPFRKTTLQNVSE